MAGEPIEINNQREAYIKCMYFKELINNLLNPSVGIYSRESVRSSEGVKINSSNPLTSDQLNDLEVSAKKTPVSQFKNFTLSTGANATYSFDARLKEALKRPLNCLYEDVADEVSEDEADKIIKIFDEMSLWDLLVIDGALWEAEAVINDQLTAEIHNRMMGLLKLKGSAYAAEYNNIEILKEKNSKFLEGLREDAVQYFFLPKMMANESGEVKEKFNMAKAVFAACELQLKTGAVPQQYHAAVCNLVDATARALAGNTDNYMSYVDALPRKYDWAKIIISAATIFFGSLMFAAGVALAPFTVGSSALISAAGLALTISAAGFFAEGIAGKVRFKEITKAAEDFNDHKVSPKV